MWESATGNPVGRYPLAWVCLGMGTWSACCCGARAKISSWPDTSLCLTKPTFRCAQWLHSLHCTCISSATASDHSQAHLHIAHGTTDLPHPHSGSPCLHRHPLQTQPATGCLLTLCCTELLRGDMSNASHEFPMTLTGPVHYSTHAQHTICLAPSEQRSCHLGAEMAWLSN